MTLKRPWEPVKRAGCKQAHWDQQHPTDGQTERSSAGDTILGPAAFWTANISHR